MRIGLDADKLPFLVMPILRAGAMEFYKFASGCERPKVADRGAKRTRKEDSLRVRDPW